MDSLEDFEKQLAADKAGRERSEREKEERRHRKHRHRNRSRERDDDPEGHRHHRSRREDGEEDGGHRHKRSRHSREDEDDRRRRHRGDDEHRRERTRRDREGERVADEIDWNSTDPKEKLPLPDEEATPVKAKSSSIKVTRDAWMTAPSGIDIDYVQRPDKRAKSPPRKEEPKRVIHKGELNAAHLENLNNGRSPVDDEVPPVKKRSYKIGDDGSQWRMTRLKAVYTLAEESGRSVDEIAVERFGSLAEFDDAREERMELDRRKTYGKGYVGKEEPTGELYKQRNLEQRRKHSPPKLDQGTIVPEAPLAAGPAVSQTELNRLRAELMKAKLRRAPNLAELEAQYNHALATFTPGAASQPIVLDGMSNRLLAGSRGEVKQIDTRRGRERGTVEANDDMSIEDMVREERRTRGQAGGEGMRLAERIAKDSRFDNDLEYMDENAEKLAKRVHKSEINLRNMAISEFQKLNRALERCPLCHQEDQNRPPLAPVVSLATRVFLTLPTEPEVSAGGAVIVPLAHRTNLLECDDDEWEEIRNFMKSLTRMYHEQGREVIFYENAATPQRHLHAAMNVVAIPYEEGATAPAYFKEAFLSTDEEWSQHKKIIDTGVKAREGLGRMAFRRSIAKEMPYFHVWFTLDGGLGHVVENADRWPKGDLFAREIIGGIVDAAPDVIKKQGRWQKGDPRVEGFKRGWRKFDWTRVLAEGV